MGLKEKKRNYRKHIFEWDIGSQPFILLSWLTLNMNEGFFYHSIPHPVGWTETSKRLSPDNLLLIIARVFCHGDTRLTNTASLSLDYYAVETLITKA